MRSDRSLLFPALPARLPYKCRVAIAAIAAILPWPLRRVLYVQWLGYELGPGAFIGHSLVAVERLRMGEGARIGSFNLIRHCAEVVLERDAQIGGLNLINAAWRQREHFAGGAPWSALELGRGAAITYMHTIDCTDRVRIGSFSIFAGRQSQILTHEIDVESGCQTSAPVWIGDHVLINSGAIVLSGCIIGSYVVTGAGSVLRGRIDQPYSLYAGVPAVHKKALPMDSGFFKRSPSAGNVG